jgi:hypothetical protein
LPEDLNVDGHEPTFVMAGLPPVDTHLDPLDLKPDGQLPSFGTLVLLDWAKETDGVVAIAIAPAIAII